MKLSTRLISAAVCAAAALTFAVSADARPCKRVHHARAGVIVVRPRSFLDPGTMVPVGSRDRLSVLQNTMYNFQPYESYSPDLLWRPDPSWRYPF